MGQGGGGDERDGDRDDISSQIWNVVKAWLLQSRGSCQSFMQSRVPGCDVGCAVWAISVRWELSDNWLPFGIFSQMPRSGWACFAFCFCLCLAVHAEELLRIFISCPEQLNADCRPSGSSYKRGRDVQETAWHLELVSNGTRISVVAWGQPIDLRSYNIHSKSLWRNQC